MANDPQQISNKITVFDNLAKKLLSSIDRGYVERNVLSKKDSEIQNIINNELNLAKGVSGGSIIDFVTHMTKEGAKHRGMNPDEMDGYNLFTQDIGNLFGYYQDLYKNRYIELSDLKFITKFIPAIGEAVKTTLDSIVGSDDLSTSITRNLEFGMNLSDEEKILVTAEIERIERDEKLLKKLRNTVYKKALVSGTNYVYCVPYKDLFEEYDRLVKDGKLVDNMLIATSIAQGAATRNRKSGFNIGNPKVNLQKSTEAVDSIEANNNYGICNESMNIINTAVESLNDKDFSSKEIDEIKKTIITNFNNVEIIDSEILKEAIEGYSSAKLMENNLANYKNFYGQLIVGEDTSVKYASADGTFNSDGSHHGNYDKFKLTGAYIKYIDASKIVPIKVYDEVIGYFYVLDTTVKKKNTSLINQVQLNETNLIMASSGLFASANTSDAKRENAVRTIVDAITDGIISNFSSKFVNKNIEFKKLIADCISANGLINTQYQIQFIPAKYMVAFSVNEDEDGMGKSILEDALFPAKLLLSLIVSKLLLYMNKSGNKTIAYVRKGPIDVSTGNHVQRTIRMLQEQNITFSDLLSTNLSFAKFSRTGNLQLPMAKNGDRLIEFETQEGQDVDLNTPMEEFLQKLAIMGTGVPSTLLETTDAADYSRSIVTANFKFAGRVASLQSDLEDPTTDLYKILIMCSNLPEELKRKVIPAFKFKLCRPRVLNNANMSDFLGQVDQNSQSIAKFILGESDETPDDTKVRQLFIKEVVMQSLPFVSWAEYEELLNKVRVQAVKEKEMTKDNNGMDTTDTEV